MEKGREIETERIGPDKRIKKVGKEKRGEQRREEERGERREERGERRGEGSAHLTPIPRAQHKPLIPFFNPLTGDLDIFLSENLQW